MGYQFDASKESYPVELLKISRKHLEIVWRQMVDSNVWHSTAMMRYLLQNAQASELSSATGAPVMFHTLEMMGINPQEFCKAFAPSFRTLREDVYVKRRMQSERAQKLLSNNPIAVEFLKFDYGRFYEGAIDIETYLHGLSLSPEQCGEIEGIVSPRKRAMCFYEVQQEGDGSWHIEPAPHGPYCQKVPYRDEKVHRHFDPIKPHIASHPLMHQWLIAVTKIAQNCEFIQTGLSPDRWKLILHQVRIEAGATFEDDPNQPFHQDGARYIVPALLLHELYTMGGRSLARNRKQPDKNLLDIKLLQGDMTIQADAGTDLEHCATKTKAFPQTSNPLDPPHRDAFGVDLEPDYSA